MVPSYRNGLSKLKTMICQGLSVLLQYIMFKNLYLHHHISYYIYKHGSRDLHGSFITGPLALTVSCQLEGFLSPIEILFLRMHKVG